MLKLLGNVGKLDPAANQVRAIAQQGGGIHITKLGARSLETNGARIGDVLTRNTQVIGSGIQSGKCGIKRHVFGSSCGSCDCNCVNRAMRNAGDLNSVATQRRLRSTLQISELRALRPSARRQRQRR